MADEKRSFQELIHHMRKAEECAVELGITRSQGSWGKVATLLKQVTTNIINLANSAQGMKAR